jgi:proteic killer suppression protein
LIESFSHKGLKELFQTGRSAKVPSELRQRFVDRLEILDPAADLRDINLPGYDLHPLHTRPVRHSIHVNGPWRITFEWDAPLVTKVNLEQYH